MKCLFWILFAGIAAIAASVLVAYLVGRALPIDHVAEGFVVVDANVAAVSQRIRDVDQQPRWRPGITAITIDRIEPDVIHYREQGGNGNIAFALYEREHARVFESVITDRKLPFGGRWIIRLDPVSPMATRVHVREEGVVTAPLYRALGRYVFDHETTLKTYLSHLAQSFPSESGS